MIFSVSHHSDSRELAGEIRCPYNQLGLLFDYIKENPNKRYNILTAKENTSVDIGKLTEQVDFVKAIASDYTIKCGSLLALKDLINRGYNAYLRFPVSDWEIFSNLLELGVSDIYIDGPICFDIDALKKVSKKVKLRLSPTINSSSIGNRQVNSFFVRPEDIQLYEGIIDVIDFQERDKDKEKVLVDIYQRGSFNYDINMLISGLPQINNLLFKRDFAETRSSCKQKCKIPGYTCHYCDRYFSVIQKSLDLVQRDN